MSRCRSSTWPNDGRFRQPASTGGGEVSKNLAERAQAAQARVAFAADHHMIVQQDAQFLRRRGDRFGHGHGCNAKRDRTVRMNVCAIGLDAIRTSPVD
jgi:hypothetical protein